MKARLTIATMVAVCLLYVLIVLNPQKASGGQPQSGSELQIIGKDGKMAGFVLKADVNRMVLAGGEDLDKIHGFSFDLFKAIERAPTVAADRGLAALGLGKAQGGRKSLSLGWFFGLAMFAG